MNGVMTQPKVTIVGSINMDLVTSTERMPEQGETVLGYDFSTYPGGKGANQAVACGRLGAEVNLIGAVGTDGFGEDLKLHLHENDINVSNVEPVTETPTGTAHIILSAGDNRIIVNPGANHAVTPALVEKHADVLKESDVVLLQLEIPLNAVEKAAQIAREAGAIVVLNPAPIQELPNSLLDIVDYITPNETEAKVLLEQMLPGGVNREKLVITQGENGVLAYENGQELKVPAYPVDPVDTTGAGDAFNGAFAYKIGAGSTLKDSIRYANSVAALSVLKAGAQSGLPTKREVEAFITKGESK